MSFPFPFFTTFVFFVIWFNIRLARRNRLDDEQQRAFWRREHAANNVRKKSLENLPYISIPVDELPFDTADELDEAVRREVDIIRRFADEEAKIVNFTGYSNTDLKLEYGTANITSLSEFDANYTSLVRALQDWGRALYDAGDYSGAEKVLSFATSTGTDIGATYELLIDLYRTKLSLPEPEAREKIEGLRSVASGIRSLSKDRIVRLLEAG